MEKDIQKSIEIYQQQLKQGDIQKAYFTLMKYMGTLKAHFPKSYHTGNISYGYLDYTYFPFFNTYLREHKLRFGVVLNHKDMQFELWLMGQNATIQKEYWEILKNSKWNRHLNKMPQYSVLEVVIEDHIDFYNEESMTDNILYRVTNYAKEIQEYLEGIENNDH